MLFTAGFPKLTPSFSGSVPAYFPVDSFDALSKLFFPSFLGVFGPLHSLPAALSGCPSFVPCDQRVCRWARWKPRPGPVCKGLHLLSAAAQKVCSARSNHLPAFVQLSFTSAESLSGPLYNDRHCSITPSFEISFPGNIQSSSSTCFKIRILAGLYFQLHTSSRRFVISFWAKRSPTYFYHWKFTLKVWFDTQTCKLITLSQPTFSTKVALFSRYICGATGVG